MRQFTAIIPVRRLQFTTWGHTESTALLFMEGPEGKQDRKSATLQMRGNKAPRDMPRPESLISNEGRLQLRSSDPRSCAIRLGKRKYPGTKMLLAQSLVLSNRPHPQRPVSSPPVITASVPSSTVYISKIYNFRYFTQKEKKKSKASSSKLWQSSVLTSFCLWPGLHSFN